MPAAERAKQFMPFAAVKGLNEALAKKERELSMIQKRELSQEMTDELNAKLTLLRKGDFVTLSYFFDGEYRCIKGEVLRLDAASRNLFISGAEIEFEDILDISTDETDNE